MGWDYIQSNDPGAVGLGKTWLGSSSGNLYIRNTTNSAWTPIGNIDSANLGSLPATGGAVSGNITGNPGWAASDFHNFATTASIAGVSIATINDVTSRITALEALIGQQISNAVATYASGLTFRDRIAVRAGRQMGATWDIPIVLPIQYTDEDNPTVMQYGDGTAVDPSECVWMVSIAGNGDKGSRNVIPTGLSGGGQDHTIVFRDTTDSAYVNPNTVSSFLAYDYLASGGDKHPQAVHYIIIALRH